MKCVNREVRVGDIIRKSPLEVQSKPSERTAELSNTKGGWQKEAN